MFNDYYSAIFIIVTIIITLINTLLQYIFHYFNKEIEAIEKDKKMKKEKDGDRVSECSLGRTATSFLFFQLQLDLLFQATMCLKNNELDEFEEQRGFSDKIKNRRKSERRALAEANRLLTIELTKEVSPLEKQYIIFSPHKYFNNISIYFKNELYQRYLLTHIRKWIAAESSDDYYTTTVSRCRSFFPYSPRCVSWSMAS